MTYVLPPPIERFAFIIEALCQAAAERSARRWIAVAIANLIWMRLRRTGARFAKLAARVRAGALPAATRASASGASDQSAESRADRQAKRRKSDDPADRSAKRLPRGFAWLLRLVPEAAVYGSQLNHLLSDPEMVALLEAAPQMGRLLRPLCQMLGIRLSEPPSCSGRVSAPQPRPPVRPPTMARPPTMVRPLMPVRPREVPPPRCRKRPAVPAVVVPPGGSTSCRGSSAARRVTPTRINEPAEPVSPRMA